MRVKLIGPSVDEFSNRGRLVNCYRDPVAGGFQVKSVPGLSKFGDAGRKYLYAAFEFGGEVIFATEGKLFRMNSVGISSEIGDLLPGNEVSISGNNGFATIAANGQYFTWDGSELKQVVTGAAYISGSVSTLGQYTVITQKGGRVIQWANLADPSTFDTLNFASAEMTDKPIIRAVAHAGQLFVFKADFLERWTLTGIAGQDIGRIPGADEPIGLKAFPLVCEFAGGLSWVSNLGNVMLYGRGAISPPQVNDKIAASEPESLLYYDWKGHGFLCVTFSDNSAWCYDLATGEWHERNNWDARISAQAFGAWLVFCESGKIGQLSDVCANFGSPMVREMVSTPLEAGGKLFQVRSVRVYPRTGEDRQFPETANVLGDQYGVLFSGNSPLGALVSASLVYINTLSDDVGTLTDAGTMLGVAGYGVQTEPALVELATSRDGRIWSAGKPRDVGEVGNYRQQLVWRNQGEFRKGYLKLEISSANDVPIMADVDLE